MTLNTQSQDENLREFAWFGFDALQDQFADVLDGPGNEQPQQDLNDFWTTFENCASNGGPLASSPSFVLPSKDDVEGGDSSSTYEDGASPASSQYYTDAVSEVGSDPNSPVSPISSTDSYELFPTAEEFESSERIPSPVNHSAFLLTRCTASSFLMSPSSTSSLSDWDRDFSLTPPPPPPVTAASAESPCPIRTMDDLPTNPFSVTTTSTGCLAACCAIANVEEGPAPQPRSHEVAMAVPTLSTGTSPVPCGGDWDSDFPLKSPSPAPPSATVPVESGRQILSTDTIYTPLVFSIPSTFLSDSIDYRTIKLEDAPAPRPRPVLALPVAPSVSTYSVAGGRDTTKFRHFCPVCGKGFKRAYNMRTHEEIHKTNRVKPWKCPVEGCQRPFARKHDLKRHIQALHPMEKPDAKFEFE